MKTLQQYTECTDLFGVKTAGELLGVEPPHVHYNECNGRCRIYRIVGEVGCNGNS
jgi:hypothetical protein